MSHGLNLRLVNRILNPKVIYLKSVRSSAKVIKKLDESSTKKWPSPFPVGKIILLYVARRQRMMNDIDK